MADKDTDKEALLQPDEGVEEEVSETEDPSDNLTPDHPRFKDVYNDMKEYRSQSEQKAKEVEQLKAEMEELRQQVNQRGQETGDFELTIEEQQALEKIDKAFQKKGYITEDKLRERESVLNRKMEFDRLSSKYDGGNKYPKFDAGEVLTHAKKQGFGDNFEAAYKDLHQDAIIQVEARKMAQGGSNPPDSESPASGDKEIKQAGLTPEQIAEMSPEEYEKNREALLQSMKESAK